MCVDLPTLQDIYLARSRMLPFVLHTPLVCSPLLSRVIGVPVYLKLENLQKTGSYKLRGALNRILTLSSDEKERGVIVSSSGNHGRAVAYVAKQLGINAVVCVSEWVPKNKVDAIRALGAEVIVYGKGYDDVAPLAVRIQKERGLTLIHGFDDPVVISGSGTIALEILEDLPDVDTVVLPLSGGGLLSGIGLAMKSVNPSIRIIGVTMERGAAMYHSLRAGRPITVKEEETIADALSGNLNLDNRYSFVMCQKYIDESVLVSEEDIAEAIGFAMKKHHLIIEGGGAVAIAALLHNRAGDLRQRQNVVGLITGSNVDLELLLRVGKQYETNHGEKHA